jgi:hypothetical protein
MDARKLKSGYKIESKLIPLLNDDKSVQNIFDSILSYSGKLKGQDTDKSQLKYASDHLKDKGRVKEYTKIIADKWNIPESKIIDAINCVIFFVKVPMLNDGYGAERRKAEVKKELSDIANLINKIETGSIDTLEISLKATGKSVPGDVHLISDAVVRKIYECLKSFPKPKIEQKTKGRPKGVEPETRQQKYCAKKIKETYMALFDSDNDLYEFTGLCFVAAGIYMEENEFYNSHLNNPTYRDYLIQKIKSLL